MLSKIFPFIDWFKGYNMTALRADAISGLTVALVLIPQSMAYAQLAGMPAYYGLYASFLPPLVAALFGSSRQLATGPVAVVSLMTAASLEPLATAGSEGYIAFAILLALMVGMFQFLLGVLKLGLVVNFLSHPVVNGFTNAAAIIIASSQFSKMFGVYVDGAEHHYETIMRVVESAIHYTHWPTLGMGVLAFAIMVGLKRVNPKIPNVLVAVVITTALSWGLGFNHDTSVSVSAIDSPAVHEAIVGFNGTIDGIDQLALQRTALGKQMEEAKSSGDPVRVLDIEHDMNVLNVQMARLKLKAHDLRKNLRSVLFAGVEQADGGLRFYEQDAVPAGMATDGRTWRVKVGNAKLDTASLKMMGGGAVVGTVPSGIPAITVPSLDLKVMLHLIPFAAIISLLGFMEAISIAKAMAAKTGQRLDPNQELIGQGLANMLGACGKSYPASGSFSRSAVNLQAGALTGMSSVFTSLMVVIVLLFFTPLLYHLPQAVLAAVIMMAVIGLINASGFIHAWKAQWYDGAISILSFGCTLAFAPHLDKGIMVGVVLSLLVFLYKSMRPRVANLSRNADESLRDATAFGLKECQHIALVRFDGPLFFANASFLEDQITERMMGNDKLRHIIIVANGINDMDASGEEALSLIVDRVRSNGLDISLCGVNEAVMAVLERTHLLEKIGKDHVYTTMETAICATHESAHRDGQEESCPLTTFCRLA
ncbi:SulP family inorganic anion transporter [Pseudodesulfovibrio indicus]|uniref:Anti-anti-sigma factor n=1 Tax=Pseudodesulfovibrio indicus TaxID=1716143 RepID=A0A126QQQ2_9BACT|nr:SulP family inorganic anion transporter [Pseudodesulfovibrio indicus]AMK12232.1 DNA repair protein [Pseudodesulfovibrio indicus]TDT86566.1 anti-anti-sigma factor [Pseudodesulfovibrio indicus]